MRVLVLTPSFYDTAPGQRFRIEQWARRLEADGFQFDFVPFEDQALHEVIYQRGAYARKAALLLRAFARRWEVSAQVRDYDVVFLHREAALLGPAVLERRLARQGIPIVYDFDDPLWLPYRSPTHGALSRLKWGGKTAQICRLATAVMVGNRLLATYAGQYNDSVFVVPSTIDLAQYPLRPAAPRDGVVTLGWTGSLSTLPFLDLVKPALRRLSEKARFRLLVVSHRDHYPENGLPVEVCARRWNAATEADDLREIDIGLAPFPDSGWTPWRCHGKLLQYMALGIPAVASPVGIATDYVTEGVTGCLAGTTEEWVAQLARLIADQPLRQALGRAGRRRVEESYSGESWARRVGEILEAVRSRR